MTRSVYDTAIFLYARGGPHPYRQPCARLVSLARDGTLIGDASVELVQEYAFVLSRRGISPPDVVRESREVAAICRLHAFDEPVLRRALGLLAQHGRLSPRDAVHAATALELGVEFVVTANHAFEDVPGLTRVDPFDAEAVLLA